MSFCFWTSNVVLKRKWSKQEDWRRLPGDSWKYSTCNLHQSLDCFSNIHVLLMSQMVVAFSWSGCRWLAQSVWNVVDIYQFGLWLVGSWWPMDEEEIIHSLRFWLCILWSFLVIFVWRVTGFEAKISDLFVQTQKSICMLQNSFFCAYAFMYYWKRERQTDRLLTVLLQNEVILKFQLKIQWKDHISKCCLVL